MSTTLTRKQREIRQREEQILAVALEMLIEHGYHGLNMDRIAEKLEYSKGTIYQHFPNKEEILLALTIRALQTRVDLFRKASAATGGTRERLQAIGMACEYFIGLYPHYFAVEQAVRISSSWEKTSEERRGLMRSLETQCMGIVSGIVRDAVACGDLVLGPDEPPEALVFGLWSMTFGAYSIFLSGTSTVDLGIGNALHALRRNHLKMLDGFGWKPLSAEYDPEAVARRHERELFFEESQKFKLA